MSSMSDTTLGDYSDHQLGSDYSMDTDTSSVPSVVPFDPSTESELYRELHGRLFNTTSALYNLPADEIEFSRLDKQHLVHQTVLGGLYQEPELVRRILAPVPGETRSILDCGTGGGNWAVAMAEEFPHAEVVGVDLAPNTTRIPPPNCRFEFDDVMLGMPHYHKSFDVVHARSCANGISDFPTFIAEMARCLKPGGILLVVEGDLQLCAETYDPMEVAYETGKGSWLCRVLTETANILKGRGAHIGAGKSLFRYLRDTRSLQCPLRLELYTPVGPWRRGRTNAETTQLMFIGELMRQNMLEFVRSLKPVILEEGFPEDAVNRWIRGTDEELSSLSVHIYTKWWYACAIKGDEEGGDEEMN